MLKRGSNCRRESHETRGRISDNRERMDVILQEGGPGYRRKEPY